MKDKSPFYKLDDYIYANNLLSVIVMGLLILRMYILRQY